MLLNVSVELPVLVSVAKNAELVVPTPVFGKLTGEVNVAETAPVPEPLG